MSPPGAPATDSGAARNASWSSIHLENVLRLSQAGAVILPPIPASQPSIQCRMSSDFVVARILDHLGVAYALMQRWGSPC